MFYEVTCCSYWNRHSPIAQRRRRTKNPCKRMNNFYCLLFELRADGRTQPNHAQSAHLTYSMLTGAFNGAHDARGMSAEL